MKNQSLILLVVAAGCGLVAMLGVKKAISQKPVETEETIQVLSAVTDIQVGMRLDELNTKFVEVGISTAPEGAVTGASTGGVLGGALGWVAGIGAIAIPGVGPFIAAGPIVAALSGAAIGATVGGIAGGLIGFGAALLEIEDQIAVGTAVMVPSAMVELDKPNTPFDQPPGE